jgi:hypothetical protein
MRLSKSHSNLCVPNKIDHSELGQFFFYTAELDNDQSVLQLLDNSTSKQYVLRSFTGTFVGSERKECVWAP